MTQSNPATLNGFIPRTAHTIEKFFKDESGEEGAVRYTIAPDPHDHSDYIVYYLSDYESTTGTMNFLQYAYSIPFGDNIQRCVDAINEHIHLTCIKHKLTRIPHLTEEE